MNDRVTVDMFEEKCNFKKDWFESLDKSFVCLFTLREVNHRGLPKNKNCKTYLWNNNLTISHKDFYANDTNFVGGYDSLIFKTAIEKLNFVNFIYSNLGFKFCSKIFTSVNCDASTPFFKLLPKVDWTRRWTVEEILADYGYTELEIENIMEDLDNFKGMDD